jgi:CBS domain-containing protein
MAHLVQQLPAHSLLVLGAAGGALFQRIRFGPGARLRASAETGALVVRAAPTRVFQQVVEPVFVSPFRQVGDTLRVHPEEALAVVDNGVLVGLVRRAELLGAEASAQVGSVMEEPLSVRIDDPLEAADELRSLFGGAHIPVTNGNDRLVGGLLPVLPA